jgi:eukaryotic-like serine/threonine-protein kinase
MNPLDPPHETASPPPDRRAVDRIFGLALDLPDADRDDFVDRESGDDETLRSTLQRLLRAERASGAVFEAAASHNALVIEELINGPAQDAVDPRVGQHLGPYRLVRRIGEGGMAVVYLGERDDGQFQQRVAIKLLRRTVDAADSINRFKAERQILSALEHPHIARLIDGGSTAEGLPYLVTEYVEGSPITDHCRQHGLGVEERLDLFLQVIDAVHHAHQNLVVHRDLKPSNVLVDGEGRARLLDFGIAKLLLPAMQPGAAPLTRVGQVVMTPEYAAPEQLAGVEVTTAADIYQLGVLLHELLTGARPERSPSGGDNAPGTVPRPSTRVARGDGSGTASPLDRPRLARRLRGDLDVILQTALQDEPTKRYASAAAMATDLRNHLRGRPIAAQPESALNLLRRLVRRSPYAVAAAVLALALLVGWLVSLQFYSQELTRERDIAEAQARRATRAYELLLGIFRRADPLRQDSVGGRSVTVWDSLDASADSMRATLRDEPGTLAELLETLARLYRTGGQLERSRDLLLEVLAIQRQAAGPESARVAIVLGELGSVETQLGHAAAGAAYLEQAVRIAARLPRAEAVAAVPVLLDAGYAAVSAGDAQAAVRQFERAESLLRESPHADPNALIEVLVGLGSGLMQLGEPARAEALALESVRLTEELYGPDHARLAGPLSALGNIQRGQGRHELAAASLRRVIAILERDYGESYTDVISARNNLALALGAAGDRRGEQAEIARLLALKRAAVGDDHPGVADYYQNLGTSLGRSGDHEAALTALAEAQRIFDAKLPATSARRAFPRLTSALVYLQQEQPAKAELAAEEAVRILERTLPEGHFATSIGRCLLGEALVDQGDVMRGAELARAALLVLERAPAEQIDYVQRCRSVTARAVPRA